MNARTTACCLVILVCGACRAQGESEPVAVQLRTAWVELPSSQVGLTDGTRVVTGARYRFVGNEVVFRFDYRKVGDPARTGSTLEAELVVEGAQIHGGAAAWTLGADGPDNVELRVVPLADNVPGIVKVQYVQTSRAEGHRPSESRTRLCFVAGVEASREARPDECVL